MKYVVFWVLVIYHVNSLNDRYEIGRKHKVTSYDNREEAFKFYEYAVKASLKSPSLDVEVDSVRIDSL